VRNAAFGDLNNDGNMDVVTVINNTALTTYLGVQLGNGDGSFRASATYLELGWTTLDVTLGDVNGDGILDSISASSANETATLRFGRGDGTFGAGTSIANLTSLASVHLADVNGDGTNDFLWSGFNNSVFVGLGAGNGTFGAYTSYLGSGNSDITTADLNGDGLLDIATAGTNVGVILNRGNGTFTAGVSFQMNGATVGIRGEDINGDGIKDLLAGGIDGTGTVGIRIGNGDGTFQANTSYVSEGGLTIAVALGDLNNDGVLDIGSSGISGTDGTVSVRLQSTTTGTNALLPFSLATRAGALQALAPLDRKLSQIANQRGAIGAFQSRVTTAINNLQTSTENYQTAASRISDADIAEESAKLVRGRILQQASTAVLAQANRQPALVLDLLRGRSG